MRWSVREKKRWIANTTGRCPIPDALPGEFEIYLTDGVCHPECIPAKDWVWQASDDEPVQILAYRRIQKEDRRHG